jgi:hypothetical protein
MYVSDTADGAFKKRTAASVALRRRTVVCVCWRVRVAVSSSQVTAASVTNTLLNMLDH